MALSVTCSRCQKQIGTTPNYIGENQVTCKDSTSLEDYTILATELCNTCLKELKDFLKYRE